MNIETRMELFKDPAKYGYTECRHCNGYGSSLKEEGPVCSQCGGLGLVKVGGVA